MVKYIIYNLGELSQQLQAGLDQQKGPDSTQQQLAESTQSERPVLTKL